MEKKIAFKNIVFSIILQLVTMVSGFVVTRIILVQFGSEVNGLVSSVNQFLNYVQLLEGGLTSVIMAALYKPLSAGESDKVNSVVKAAQNFFKKIGLIYLVYAVGVAFVYPLCKKVCFDYKYCVILILVLGMNLFVQYFFSLTYKILINADRRSYYVSLTQIIITVLNTISVIVCAKYFNDIIVIKFFSALIFFIQPIMFSLYVKKHYKLDLNVEPDKSAVKDRWNGFGINLAYFIHTNTDVVVLTIFSTFANVSIYGVYSMVIKAMKNLVMSISQAIVPSFGKTVAEGDRQKMNNVFDIYELVMYAVSVVMFTCGIILITPFVLIFTNDVVDADYNQKWFGIILAQAEMVYCVRDSYVAAAYSAGHFKQISKYAYAEALINIVISVILVHKIGLIGIAIGTLISMIYRMIVHIYYVKKNILFRDYKKSVKAAVIFFGLEFLVYFVVTELFKFNINSYMSFVLYGAITFGIVSVLLGIAMFAFYRKETKYILKIK